MPDVQVEERNDFNGGISRLNKQTKNQAFLIRNARPVADGELIVRNGQVQVAQVGPNPTLGSIQALLPHHTDSVGLHYYTIKRGEGLNDKAYDFDSELVGPSLGSGIYSSIVLYKGVVFFSNGSGPISYHTAIGNRPKPWGQEVYGVSAWGNLYSRTNITGDPTPPVGPHLIIHKDRMYVGQTNGNVSYSNAGLFTTLPTTDFPALNFFQISDKGNPVNGLAKGGDDLLIMFTDDAYTTMTGVPGDDGSAGDVSLEVNNEVGCGSSRSISFQGNRVPFFGSNRRPYMLEGTFLRDLDPNDFVAEYFNAVSNSVIDAVSTRFFGNEIWWSLPKGGSRTDNIILIYNINKKRWDGIFDNINGYVFGYLSKFNTILVASHTGGFIWQQDIGEFDRGGLIPFELIGRSESFGTLNKEKTFNIYSAVARLRHGEVLTFQYALDDKDQFNDLEAGFALPKTVKQWGKEVYGKSSWNDSELPWGKEVYGVSPWSDNELQKNVMRFKSKTNIHGYSLRLRCTGNIRGGMVFSNYRIEASIDVSDKIVK